MNGRRLQGKHQAVKRSPSKTRIVGYAYDGAFDEPACDRLLEKAKSTGVITQFDCGSRSDLGTVVWFEGPPGQLLRELRRAILRLAPPGKRQLLR